MPYLSFKNIKIHYKSSGKGKVVVLLHGFLENMTMWKDIIPNLTDKYEVICIDLLGHGHTDNLGYVHSMEMQAEIVEFVLSSLKINSCAIIGHSMGGYVALALAEKHSQIIKGLCLMNSTAMSDNEEKKTNRDRGIKAVKYNPEVFVRMAIPNLFSEDNKDQFPKEIAEITQEALKMSAQGIIAAMEGMKIRKDRSNLYHKIKAPIQMIIGKQDPALNYDSLHLQTNKTPVDVIEFPDGHMSHIENKSALISTLKSFILNCYA